MLPTLRPSPWVVPLVALLAACATDPHDSPAACDMSRLTGAELATLLPAPPFAGLPGPRLTLLGAGDAIAADPTPWRRGDHRGQRIEALGPDCEPFATPTAAVLPAHPVAATTALIGAEGLSHPLLGALLVTGADRGADQDAAAWSQAFAALRVSARHLHAPPAASIGAAVAALCGGLDAGASAILVTAGAGTPAGGGALVLSHEAITWAAISDALGRSCGHVGLIVWVVDASYAGDVAPASPGAPPSLVWNANDALVQSGARLDASPGAGGALSAAIAEVVVERVGALCLGVARPRAAELAAVFSDDGVRPRLVAERWARLGVPALAALASRGTPASPRDAELLARYLDLEVPATLVTRRGAPASAGRCHDDAGCRNLAAGCALPACHRLACDDGRCVPVADVGASCDVGADCVIDPVCDALGRCTGELVTCDDDGDPCSVAGCEPGVGCVARPVPGAVPCDDGDPCTEGDRCDAAGRCVGAPVACDDGDPCTLDTCAPGVGCVHQPARLPCDDGDPCTFADACVQGVCAGTPLACDDGNPCTFDRCDPDTASCVSTPVFDGTPCDDGDPCTVADRCLGALCVGLPRACDDGLACTLDACEAGACRHASVPGTCVADGACVAVGDNPPTRPCARCAATGLIEADAAQEGQPCGAPLGLDCVADRCAGGVCARFFDPHACLDEGGECVGVGEAVTACLRCAGGGVAVLAPEGTECPTASPCARGRCAPTGLCVDEPVGCCPAEPVSCGATLSGVGIAGPGRVDDWSCATGEPWPGPERTWYLEAPCDGTIRVEVSAAMSASVAISQDLDACAEGVCVAYGLDPEAPMVEGESLAITLGEAGGGAWSLDVVCDCD